MPADQPAAPAEKQTVAKTAADGAPADLTNLALGAGLLLSAFLVFWMGLYLANHVALRALVASFGTFALVWVLHRLRIFHRPHGGLIAAGSVALFAAALPFIERGFLTLDRAAKAKLAGEPAKTDSEPANTMPVPTRQQPAEIPPPPTPAPPEDDIVRELIAPVPDSSVGKIIRVTQEAKVLIGGRKFLIKAGSKFPFRKLEDGTVTFQAGDQEVTIDAEMVTFMGQSKETPEEITKLAGAELMRRYPAIRAEGSPENKLYVARVNALKDEMPDLFKDPHWPIIIGEQLAAHEGWTRADAPPDDTTPPAESPKAPQPPDLGVPPPPPIPSDVPQEAPK
jgi:hypothetical protein